MNININHTKNFIKTKKETAEFNTDMFNLLYSNCKILYESLTMNSAHITVYCVKEATAKLPSTCIDRLTNCSPSNVAFFGIIFYQEFLFLVNELMCDIILTLFTKVFKCRCINIFTGFQPCVFAGEGWIACCIPSAKVMYDWQGMAV